MQFRQVRSIGGKGEAPDQFTGALRGIAVDSQDRLYAVGDSILRVYETSGKPLRQWTTARPGFSVAVAPDGVVYAGEQGQVEIFDGSGKLTDTWSDAERLGLVTAIGFHEDSVLFGDVRGRCIRRYNAQGEFRNSIAHDSRRRGLLIPNGAIDFSVDSAGIIHAANPGKHRVERYTAEGELLGHFGRFDGRDPAGFPGCCNPTNVCVTGLDRVYVTEKADPRAKVFDFEGNLLTVIATDVFHLACKNMDIAVDSRGRVHVIDTVKLEILTFEPTEGGAKT